MSQPQPTLTDWQLAEVLVEPQELFVLWAVKVFFCTRLEDFRHHFGDEFPIDALVQKLELQGFLQRDGAEFVLTQAGEEAVARLGESQISAYANLAREAAPVQIRFSKTDSRSPEETYVERPFIEQLKGLGWMYMEGDTGVPYLTERESFREVLLTGRLRKALHRINLDDDGQPWLDESRINQAVGALGRLGAHKLTEANQAATEFLLKGTVVEGDFERHGDREQTIRFIDFEHPERNDFLVINQFRVDPPWSNRDKDFIIPDLVLFVNGIPLVVVECKSPEATNPIEEGITQLLRYANQRDWVADDEGAERLFHYNQFLVSSYWYEARVGTISASYQHYLEWKDTSPVPLAQVAAELGVRQLSSQQMLIAGMLRPAHLLDIVRNFTLFRQSGGRTIKIVARYQQFRAVQEAIRRLQHGRTRTQHGENDQRGGIIWHTQGSGKSLTMVFLMRKMRTLSKLRRFKVVIVTDRTDLEQQLSNTATLTGETVRTATGTERLKTLLREEGPDLVFAMIQKYHRRDEDVEEAEETESFTELNTSESILVLIDEAHRSQANMLHANLMWALPNCAKIGFTGTPILISERKKTHEIFGDFIDRYTIQQSEADGATVRILYEGRTAEGMVADGRSLDQLFEDMFQERTPEELEAIKAKYATTGNVLEAPKLIAAKAEDMLCHYVDVVLPNHLKAQVVASSRLAAVRYREAFVTAQQKLVTQLEALDPSLLGLKDHELAVHDRETQFLVRAHAYLNTIRCLEFATIISPGKNDDPAWREWTDESKQDVRIERFKKPLVYADPAKQDNLAFLCVQNMLLVGFDAPVEQVLYLDRFMQGHTLLQAIARVNRTYPGKDCGFVVDYYGVGHHLKKALAVYSAEDVHGALASLKDELPKLADRHRRVLAIFQNRGIENIEDVDAWVLLLGDMKIRADFEIKLERFLESMDIVLPRPEALPYVRDAKLLGFINKSAANLYRDSQLDLASAGYKVRQLIDQYIVAHGVNPKVGPVSILADNFEDAVDSRRSDRTKAAEMEHAARHYVSRHFHEDPAYYKKLSERLEKILRNFENNWAELVAALRQFVREVRKGRPADETGLDPRTQAPFLGILAEEVGAGGELPKERLTELARLTVEMVAHIQQEICAVDFWRNIYAQNVLRAWTVNFLDDHDVLPFNRLQRVADRMVDLAKALHARLTT